MNEYIEMWKHYADFSGDTNVKGFWMAMLINWVIGLVLGFLGNQMSLFVIVTNIYGLAVFIPDLAIQVRRFNDAGKSWANIFWWFLPIVGWIIAIVKLCAPSANFAK